MERVEQRFSAETRQVLFWALMAAGCAGETTVTHNRVLIALLRSTSVADYCTRAGVTSADVINANEDPHALPFEECARRIERDLSQNGLKLGSKEHIASVRFMPLEGTVQSVIQVAIEPRDSERVTPLDFLLAMMRADPALAARLARHGLEAEGISASLNER